MLKESHRPAPPRISVNTFVIHSGGRIALVDTGSQNSMGPTLGQMPKHIAAAGVDAEAERHDPAHPYAPGSFERAHRRERQGNLPPCGAGRRRARRRALARRRRDGAGDRAAADALLQPGARADRRIRTTAASRTAKYFPAHRGAALRPHARPTGYMISSKGESLSSGATSLTSRTSRPAVQKSTWSRTSTAGRDRNASAHRSGGDRPHARRRHHMHFPGFLNLNRRPNGGYELIPKYGSRRSKRAPALQFELSGLV